jgi:hypothetical protein
MTLTAKDDTGLMTMEHVVKFLREIIQSFEDVEARGWSHNFGRYTASYRKGRTIPSRIYLKAPDNTFTSTRYPEALRPALSTAVSVVRSGGSVAEFQGSMQALGC